MASARVVCGGMVAAIAAVHFGRTALLAVGDPFVTKAQLVWTLADATLLALAGLAVAAGLMALPRRGGRALLAAGSAGYVARAILHAALQPLAPRGFFALWPGAWISVAGHAVLGACALAWWAGEPRARRAASFASAAWACWPLLLAALALPRFPALAAIDLADAAAYLLVAWALRERPDRPSPAPGPYARAPLAGP
jgi:hypothetical protein